MRWSTSLPTTLAGAEVALALAVLGLRACDLIQLAVAAHGSLQRSTASAIDAVLMAAYFIESVAFAIYVVRCRRYLSTTWAALDCGLAFAIVALGPIYTTSSDRVGTWAAWGYAVSVGAAFGAGIGFRRWHETVIAAFALGAAYVVVSLPAAHGDQGSTVVSNTIAYFAFALVTRALASYLRRLGRDADAARRDAARLGAELEYNRHRQLLHDHAAVLRLLADPAVPPELASVLREQATGGERRVRAFLGQGPGWADDLPGPGSDSVAAVVKRAVAGYSDLPIDLVIGLATTGHLSTEAAVSVRAAVETVLSNVRLHANADNVTVHAETDAGRWEVCIRDDGRGFDQTGTKLGFGLGVQLPLLAGDGITATVQSAPGEGTVVTLEGVCE